MKKKLSRILGIGLTVTLLTSLMLVATPVSAGTVAWSAVTLPSATGSVITVGTSITDVVVSPDGGTIFAVESSTPTVFFSTNGGTTFTAATSAPAAAVTAIAVSPAFAADSTVFVADTTGGGTLYKSTNAGVSYTQVAASIAGEVITSIAISPNYATDGLVAVGTTNALAATFGDVRLLGAGAFGFSALALNQDVTSVAFSPAYPSDRTILAVGSVVGATTLNTNMNWTLAAPTAWNLSWGAAAVNAAGGVGDASAIVSSGLAIPSDYNGLDITKRTAYVATSSGLGTDDVYRVAGAVAGVALDPTAAADDAMSSLAYSGTTAAGTLFAGDAILAQVYRSSDAPTALATLGTWLPATVGPTGAAANPTMVTLSHDFATSNTVYAGTGGLESAFSVSDDGGVNFYQTALIRTVIAAIADATPSPTYTTDKTLFMVTSDGVGGTNDSLWKTTDGGLTWTRVWSFPLTNGTGIVRLTPNYATDGVVIVAETGAGTTRFSKSITSGASWTNMISMTAIADVLVTDANTTYVASDANGAVEKNVDGAWHWGAGAAGLAPLVSISMSSNGHILVGNNAGVVYRSIDAGLIYLQVGATLNAGASAMVAFDANYATNNIIYAGDGVGAVPGVFRIDASTALITTAWTVIDGSATTSVVGLAVAADGTLYAGDGTAAAVGPPELGGAFRSLNPTAGTALVPTAVFEAVSTLDGITAADALVTLKTTTDSTLFAVESTTPKILTYSDTATGMPALSSPAYTAASVTSLENIPTLTTATTAAFSWAAVTGATAYSLEVNSAATFAAATDQGAVATALTTAGTVSALTGGTTYYWRVRVTTPVLSAWSATSKFTTALPAVTTPAAVAVPALGATGVAITPTFTWPAVAGATDYDFMISEGSTFSIVEYSASEPANTHVAQGLDYSTTYYWRVRPTSASSTGAWTAFSFTTMAEPVATAEPEVVTETIIITEPGEAAPAPIVTVVEVPVQGTNTITEQPIPSYLLWTIIGIGAVLLIALITLIVRTRRVA